MGAASSVSALKSAQELERVLRKAIEHFARGDTARNGVPRRRDLSRSSAADARDPPRFEPVPRVTNVGTASRPADHDTDRQQVRDILPPTPPTLPATLTAEGLVEAERLTRVETPAVSPAYARELTRAMTGERQRASAPPRDEQRTPHAVPPVSRDLIGRTQSFWASPEFRQKLRRVQLLGVMVGVVAGAVVGLGRLYSKTRETTVFIASKRSASVVSAAAPVSAIAQVSGASPKSTPREAIAPAASPAGTTSPMAVPDAGVPRNEGGTETTAPVVPTKSKPAPKTRPRDVLDERLEWLEEDLRKQRERAPW